MKLHIKLYAVLLAALGSAALTNSCKKLVLIPPPVSTITTSETFRDSANASAAVQGIYLGMAGGYNISVANGGITLLTGMSSDELGYGNPRNPHLYANTLMAEDVTPTVYLWTPAYQQVYRANACIEGVKASTGISQATKDQFTGEAEFCRALMNFYLLNLFGDIPLVTTTDYKTNAMLPRAPKAQVYQAMVADLLDAQSKLPADYAISGGQRIRANKWAATALLARVYLYLNDYKNAMTQASTIINNTGTFSLVSDLNKVFLMNSTEAILQWNLNVTSGTFNATPEGHVDIPSPGYPPEVYLAPQLLSAFEAGDQRQSAWLFKHPYAGTFYYCPYKYKIGPPQAVPNTAATEYYMVLRLAEQYLVRAEANAQLGNLSDAVTDLNTIRARAGLAPLAVTLNQPQILAAVAQERRIELFAEWGHRWFDLKRTGQVDAVMSVVTPQKYGGTVWNSYQQLYPISSLQLRFDPNLTQNPGY